MSKLLLKKSLLLIVTLGITSVLSEVFSQKADYTDKYCLDFAFKGLSFDGWSISAMNLDFRPYKEKQNGEEWDALLVESSGYPEPMSFTRNVGSNYRDRFCLRMSLKRKILLPIWNREAGAKIMLTCKSENLKRIDLIVTHYDQQENILQKDTLHANHSQNVWRIHEMNIRFPNTTFLDVSIEGEGVDRTYNRINYWSSYNTFGHIDSTCSQRLYLNKLDIYLDNKPIDLYPIDEQVVPFIVDQSDITSLSFDNDNLYFNIPELRTKRIIALGESVHGSETMADIAVWLMKHQVQNNNCKLIVLEKMGEEMLLINRFIQGDKSIRIDQVLNHFAYPQGSLNTLFSLTQFRDLCLWLKDYNETAAEKVWLLGMDFEWIVFHRRLALADYLLTLNEQVRFAFINEICEDLLSGHEKAGSHDMTNVQTLWQNNKQTLMSSMDQKEMALIDYYLSNMPPLSVHRDVGNPKDAMKRDSLMSKHLQFFLDLLCDNDQKAVVHAHFLHTNYIDTHNQYSMGYYSKQKWRDDYFNIGLFAAQGEGLTVFRHEPVSLVPPITNSLEFGLSQVDVDFFYLPVSKINAPFLLMRSMGTYDEDQYKDGFISPIGRMGGVIFSKHSTPVKKPDIRPNELNARIQKALQRLKGVTEEYGHRSEE